MKVVVSCSSRLNLTEFQRHHYAQDTADTDDHCTTFISIKTGKNTAFYLFGQIVLELIFSAATEVYSLNHLI